MTTFFEQFKKPDDPETVPVIDDDGEPDPGTPMAQIRVEHSEQVGPDECEVPK